MTPKEKIKVSKYLCLLLRHNPSAGNLVIDGAGWANTTNVLIALKDRFAGVSLSVLKEIVAEDDKQRYSFSGESIRANQGHSIPVDLGLVEAVPPECLLHGTARKTLWMIRRDGLLPMDRQYLHLSETHETAVKVGKRHGDPVVITVRALEMHRSGLSFFRSENGVWLTKSVPVEYLDFGEAYDD